MGIPRAMNASTAAMERAPIARSLSPAAQAAATIAPTAVRISRARSQAPREDPSRWPPEKVRKLSAAATVPRTTMNLIGVMGNV